MKRHYSSQNDGGIVFGFVILGIGILLLLKKIGIFVPSWVLTWPMILIVIGIFTLIKHEFKSLFGVFMLFLGSYFLLRNEFNMDFALDRYIFPVALIVLGVYLITKKKKEKDLIRDIQAKWQVNQKSNTMGTSAEEVIEDPSDPSTDTGKDTKSNFGNMSGNSFSDTLNIDAILSGVNKRILSKNLKGGKLTAAFGGIDLDLTQADIQGPVTVQVDVIFGGMKLVVPPHWDVRAEVSNIAAGIEDKRIYRESAIDPNKVLILKGTVLFGGLEIKSY
jgi:predicted membrane protein